MIGFPHPLPNLTWWNNRTFPLTEDWLVESVATAVDKDSTTDRNADNLIPQIAYGVVGYLENDYPMPTISAGRVEAMLRSALRAAGHADGAKRCHLTPPTAELILSEIAAYAEYELHFFQTLRRELDSIMRTPVRAVRLMETRESIKILARRQRWRENCDLMYRHLLDYIRQVQIHHHHQGHSVAVEIF